MSDRRQRAEERRRRWRGEIVVPGTPKGALYEDLTIEERLAAFAELNRRVWTAAGLLPLPPLDRKDWPGEILDLRERG